MQRTQKTVHSLNGIGVFYFGLLKQLGRARLDTVNHFTFKQVNIFFIPVAKV